MIRIETTQIGEEGYSVSGEEPGELLDLDRQPPLDGDPAIEEHLDRLDHVPVRQRLARTPAPGHGNP